MPINLKNRIWIAVYMLCFFLFGILSNAHLNYPFELSSNIVFSIAIVVWVMNAQRRIVNRRVRLGMLIIGAMMLFWIILRGCKYVFFMPSDTAGRYLWYLYYIPMTGIPLISFHASLRMRTSANAHFNHKVRWLYLPWALLVLGILTNDFHQQAFIFYNGIANWETEYLHGWLYVTAVLWVFVLLIANFIFMLGVCTLTIGRKYAFIPLIAPIVSLGYFMSYPRLANFMQLPEMFCFMMMGFWEGCIQIGFIPSSSGHLEFLEHSGLPIQLVNNKDRVVYKSKGSEVWPEGYRQSASRSADFILHQHPIPGGHVYWEQDISRINRLEEKLQETNQRLSEESDLLQAENRLKEELAQITVQNRIYERIEKSVTAQSERIEKLVEGAMANPDLFAVNMSLASFYTVYIKRKANLALHANQNSTLSVQELMMSIRESLDYLAHCGVACAVDGNSDAFVDSTTIIKIYDTFESAVEAALPGLSGLMVRVEESDEALTLRMTMEHPTTISPAQEVTVEDDTAYIKFSFRKDGDV